MADIVVFAAWPFVLIAFTFVGGWLLSSEWLLLNKLRSDEPAIFADLGAPVLLRNLVAPGLTSGERALIAQRSTSASVARALADYRLAINTSRVLLGLLIVWVVFLVSGVV